MTTVCNPQKLQSLTHSARGHPARNPQLRASVPTLSTTTSLSPHLPTRFHAIFSGTTSISPSLSLYRLHDIYRSGPICLSAPARYLSIFLSCVVASEHHAATRRVPPPRHLFVRTDRICTVIVFEATLLLCRARARRSGRVTLRGALPLRSARFRLPACTYTYGTPPPWIHMTP